MSLDKTLMSLARRLLLTFKRAIPRKPNFKSETFKKQQHFYTMLNNEIKANYQNSNYKIDQLARSLLMSNRQLNRKCMQYIESNPVQFLKEFRLHKAALLLKDGKPTNQVALSTGFSSHSYFSQCFKQKFGISPSEYYKRDYCPVLK